LETDVKLTAQLIAETALDLLDEVGLDGLTMRTLAGRLDVKAPALYWHVKNKRELLDTMAEHVFAEAVEGLEAPRRGTTWEEWLAALVGRLRGAMLRRRDGAKVLAGTFVSNDSLWRTMELTLRMMIDAGFDDRSAIRAATILMHYTIGYVIEEQSRMGADYASNPYVDGRLDEAVDAGRFPLTAAASAELAAADTDGEFDHGIAVILAGIRASGA
jgi:TetR/AcrR family transcriptional regulator, tetracycline repressor protein